MSLKSFTAAYIEAALWSSTDNADDSGGEPLDRNYGESDISRKLRMDIEHDCAGFYQTYEEIWSDAGWSDEQAGHDFWLSRNGHGAGFFDRNFSGSSLTGDALQKAAGAYGTFDLYIGDDGKVHGL